MWIDDKYFDRLLDLCEIEGYNVIVERYFSKITSKLFSFGAINGIEVKSIQKFLNQIEIGLQEELIKNKPPAQNL